MKKFANARNRLARMQQNLCDHEWVYAMPSADRIEMVQCTKCSLRVFAGPGMNIEHSALRQMLQVFEKEAKSDD